MSSYELNSKYDASVSASYPEVFLARAKEGEKETWSLAAHHQSLASTLRKTKRLRGGAASVLLFNTIYVDIETLPSSVATMVWMDTN